MYVILSSKDTHNNDLNFPLIAAFDQELVSGQVGEFSVNVLHDLGT